MDIDPAVRNDIPDRPDICLVLEVQLFDENTEGHIVAVREAGSDAGHIFRHLVHPADQIPEGHGRDETVALQHMFLSVLFIGQRGNPVPLPAKPGDLRVSDEGASQSFDSGSGYFPEFAGAKLGVLELFDQRGVDLAVFDMKSLAEDILEDAGNRKTLGTLGAPGSVNLTGVTSPEVFGVIFEEQRVELFPERVDIEILKVVFREFMQKGANIAEAALQRVLQAHIPEGLRFQGDRIIIKPAVKEDAGYTVAGQHDHVFLRRIRSARRERHFTVQENVISGGGALQRHHLFPPVVDLRHL